MYITPANIQYVYHVSFEPSLYRTQMKLTCHKTFSISALVAARHFTCLTFRVLFALLIETRKSLLLTSIHIDNILYTLRSSLKDLVQFCKIHSSKL